MAEVAVFALFGTWSLLCVLAGAWIGGRQQSTAGLPPIDPQKMFNWIRHGDADGDPKDKEPPLEEDKGSDFQL